MTIPLLLLFVLVEIIQTLIILFEKKIFRGIKGIILTEILELPLELYLILHGEVLIILIVIGIIVFHWLVIAIFPNFLKQW